jgi:hypothetical protein
MKDPILEDIRQVRDDHSKRFNYDLDAICEDYKTHQALAGERLVRLKPRAANNKLQPTTQSAARYAPSTLGGG